MAQIIIHLTVVLFYICNAGIHRALFDLNLIVVVVFFSFNFLFLLFSLAVNMFGQVIYKYIFHSCLYLCLFVIFLVLLCKLTGKLLDT